MGDARRAAVTASAGLISGHLTLADWLFLVAAVVFAVATIAAYVRQAVPRDWLPCLVPLGLTLVAVAWLVL
jgi:hypothetical protein